MSNDERCSCNVVLLVVMGLLDAATVCHWVRIVTNVCVWFWETKNAAATHFWWFCKQVQKMCVFGEKEMQQLPS